MLTLHEENKTLSHDYSFHFRASMCRADLTYSLTTDPPSLQGIANASCFPTKVPATAFMAGFKRLWTNSGAFSLKAIAAFQDNALNNQAVCRHLWFLLAPAFEFHWSAVDSCMPLVESSVVTKQDRSPLNPITTFVLLLFVHFVYKQRPRLVISIMAALLVMFMLTYPFWPSKVHRNGDYLEHLRPLHLARRFLSQPSNQLTSPSPLNCTNISVAEPDIAGPGV
jgi:hypothetical protein